MPDTDTWNLPWSFPAWQIRRASGIQAKNRCWFQTLMGVSTGIHEEIQKCWFYDSLRYNIIWNNLELECFHYIFAKESKNINIVDHQALKWCLVTRSILKGVALNWVGPRHRMWDALNLMALMGCYWSLFKEIRICLYPSSCALLNHLLKEMKQHHKLQNYMFCTI